VMRIFDACMQLEAFDRAQPSRQPDAVPPANSPVKPGH